MSNGYGKQTAGFGLTRAHSVDLIVQACLNAGVTDTRQIAYVLATAQHESKDFTAPEEEWGRKQAVTHAYHGGEDYYGRGYAHITHRENYRDVGTQIGLGEALSEYPARAAEPGIATQVLVLGMRDGSFVKNHALDTHINAFRTDYVGARAIINPGDMATANAIAGYARHWEEAAPGLVQRIEHEGIAPLPPAAVDASALSLSRGDANQDVFEMQQYLAALDMRDDKGRGIAPDGDFGPGTEEAVKRYQRGRGAALADGRVDATLFAQLRADTLQAHPDFRRRTVTDLYGPLKDGLLQRGDRGEPVYELRLQLEGLGYIRNPRRNWNHDRDYDDTIETAISELQTTLQLKVTGAADADTRRRLNDQATAHGLAPTTEFDRAENWPPMPPPYTRAEYRMQHGLAAQPEVARAQSAQAHPAPGGHAEPDHGRNRRLDEPYRGAPPQDAVHPEDANRQDATRARVHASASLDPSHPDHPHHALYQGCAIGVAALDRQLGRTPDEHSARMAASLAALAARNGLDRVDHVVLSVASGELQAGRNVFVVQGRLDDPAHLRAHMPTALALDTPAHDAFRALAEQDPALSRQQAWLPAQDQQPPAHGIGARQA